MLRTLSSLCLVAGLMSSGCSLGRSPNAKTAAYIANGALVVGGAAIIADGQHGGDEQQLITTVGLIPLIAGVAGIAVNLAVDTAQEPEVKPMPKGAQLVLSSEK